MLSIGWRDYTMAGFDCPNQGTCLWKLSPDASRSDIDYALPNLSQSTSGEQHDNLVEVPAKWRQNPAVMENPGTGGTTSVMPWSGS
jgi:hypothetical protein